MAAPVQKTPEQWQARALELAAEHHTLHTAKLVGRRLDDYLFTVPSSSEIDPHRVWWLADGSVRCDCQAGERSMACRHAGAVVDAVARMQVAMRPRTAAQVARDEMWTAIWQQVEG